MNVEYAIEENGKMKKKQEVFTMTQWNEIVPACAGYEQKFRTIFRSF